MRRHATEILAALAFLSAIALTVYQHFACNDNDCWFEWEQFWHYEPFIACALVASIALLVGKYLGKRGY
jgi:hypothetical protein